jgi:hypothetical protein
VQENIISKRQLIDDLNTWEKLKYFGTTVTNKKLFHEQLKRRLHSCSACYHSVHNLLSSRLLSKNVKIRICKTIILLVYLCGCGTWSLTLREEHKLRVFENRVLRRIFGPKRDGITGGRGKIFNEELGNLQSSSNLIRMIKSMRMGLEEQVARIG